MGQHLADLGVLVGPVSLEVFHALRLEGLRDCVMVECHALIDEAGDAPRGREVEEDRLALGPQLVE